MQRTVQRVHLVLAAILLAGCATTAETVEEEPPLPDQLFYSVDGSVDDHQGIADWLSTVRELHDERMQRQVAVAEVPIVYAQPESRMGNLAADMLRSRATHELERSVEVAFLDPGRFGIEWRQGVITRSDIFDWMPYNDTLVILTLNGAELRRLADEIALAGGLPVSGMRMVISDEGASGVLVRSESIDEGREYRVATSSYVVRSGRFESIAGATSRQEYPILIRDMMADYARGRGELNPDLDWRVRER